jgi:predicted metal-binding protein
MGVNRDELIEDALSAGAAHAAIADTSTISFHEDFRKACEKNTCQRYDTNWMGPPAIGPITDLIDKVRKYREGLLFQTVCHLDSPFDYKGMMAGAQTHEEIFRRLLKKVKDRTDLKNMLPLNAGCCRLCERCAYLDNDPCRHPDEAVSSVEAYGINVIALEKSAGIPIHNGKNTVSYVGLILFKE